MNRILRLSHGTAQSPEPSFRALEEVIQTRVGSVESIVSVTSLFGLQVPKYPGTSYSPAWLTNKQLSSLILERSLPCVSLCLHTPWVNPPKTYCHSTCKLAMKWLQKKQGSIQLFPSTPSAICPQSGPGSELQWNRSAGLGLLLLSAVVA